MDKGIGTRTKSQEDVAHEHHMHIHPNEASHGELDEGSSNTFLQLLKSIIHKDVDSQRVSVPLFLLEPTSVLDNFGGVYHADCFESIHQDITDPIERMERVVAMFFTGIYKSFTPTKKPFNPILGEQFLCRFVTEEKEAANWDTLENDPSVTRLVAEQVSHHPPIAVFFAENKAKKLRCVLVQDVKGKFTGLGFNIKNLSYGRINVGDNGEEYVCTYPNGHVNGLFTGRFSIVWDGEATITCKTTGYETFIKFKEKKWFRAEKCEMEGRIYHLDDPEKTLRELSGSWIGEIFSKSPQEQQPKLLINLEAPRALRKVIKPLEKQDDMETFKVWGECFDLMKAGDNSKAGKIKSSIEDKQRKMERERGERKEVFVPKYFYFDEASEIWRFHEERQPSDTVGAQTTLKKESIVGSESNAGEKQEEEENFEDAEDDGEKVVEKDSGVGSKEGPAIG